VTYRYVLSLSILMTLGVAPFAAPAMSDDLRIASYEPVGDQVKAPSGWLQFCRDWPSECPSVATAARDVAMTADSWKTIEDVNLTVNRQVKPVTDKDHYDRSEYWTYPQNNEGDCEDYLLLKRKILMEKGFPQAALLITVVALSNGDGHAVLTVRTTRGDFVLDNLRNDVLPWTETGYRFVKRQSQTDPNVWTALGNEANKAVAAAK
jgi:predicted transglutaminase-like cysteine proteinase